MESPVEGVKMTQLMNGQVEELREAFSERPASPSVSDGVSVTTEYQRVPSSSDYQSGPLDYQSAPSSEYQPAQEYHTGQQEYQEYHSATEYQGSSQEYQTVQPEYHPLPLQPPPPPRSPAYGSPTRGVPLRRTESRTFVPAPPQQRSGSPLNFQPQNYQRPPQNNYRPSVPQPSNQAQQFRPLLQKRSESPTQNQDYQRIYTTQLEKKPLNFNPVPREGPQPQPQSPQNTQSPPIPRQAPPQNIVRRPNPWALLKQKLPADVRQQFVPIRRPQFEGRSMQSPDQNVMQRPPGDGQAINTGMGRGGNPNPGMQSPNPGIQTPPPNPMYNGRPSSGNPPQKLGMPMQRPVLQEGRESPSPHQPQGVQRVMSGERRQPYDMQRTDSVRSLDTRGMTPPQPGTYSPSPPRPMGERGRETPHGPPRTPKDDDDDVVYSSVNDPRMNRAQTPVMRPPSGPRPGLPPDINRDINPSRPLSRTESRQSFEARTPSGLDIRGETKLTPRESPLARPLSSDIAKTPFQYRPENQNTPPPSPKPDFQSPRPQSISPQDSLDRQRVESRGLTPSNPAISPKPSPDLRPNSRTDDSKQDSGKLTPVGGEDNQTSSVSPSEQANKPGTPNVGYEKPSSVLSGSVSPAVKSNEPSRTGTPLSGGAKDNQQSELLNSKSPDISQNTSPTPTKGSESDSGTPIPEKDSGSHTREVTPNKTPDISENVDTSKTERPKSLKRSPSLKQDLSSSPTTEGRKTPLVRTPSRTSSAGKGNELRSPLQRKPSGKRPKTPDGDHDSGVDENTQRQDGPKANGDLTSPTKSPSKIPAPKKLSSLPSPTKSTKASPKTPEAPPTAEKKKVPMNKIQVGAAPSPNLKTVKSKIGSLQNATHKPGGGNVKIEHRKLDWKAEPRIAAKNDMYQPGGGDKKIPQVKLKWEAKPKVGSLDNATHKPGGGEKKIESVKLDFKDKAKPKVGSKDNLKHHPGGGNVKTPSQDGNPGDIEDQKLEVKAQSKIGSLDNVKHRPGGGDRKIFDDKEYLRQMSGATSRAASEGIPSGTQGGWSSASTSRRTSRDRRTSGDRRYHSEIRLRLQTPEPRMGASTKEEHCSLWERHNRDTKSLVKEEETLGGQESTTHPDPMSPIKSTSSSEYLVARNTDDDKDLNSNKPDSGSIDTYEVKKSKPEIAPKYTDTNMNQPKEDGNCMLTVEKDVREEIKNYETKYTTEIKETITTQCRPQQDLGPSKTAVSLNNNLPKTMKEENIDKMDGVETVTINTIKMEKNQNAQMKLESKEDSVKKMAEVETVTNITNHMEKNENDKMKLESKEDMVREIKEVDSKEEIANQNGISDLSNNTNCISNQSNDNEENANLNPSSNASNIKTNLNGAELKLK